MNVLCTFNLRPVLGGKDCSENVGKFYVITNDILGIFKKSGQLFLEYFWGVRDCHKVSLLINIMQI